jgi:hypothetical protein
LPEHTYVRRAEREPDRQLARARGRTHEQQVHHVRAGDEQDANNRTGQQPHGAVDT